MGTWITGITFLGSSFQLCKIMYTCALVIICDYSIAIRLHCSCIHRMPLTSSYSMAELERNRRNIINTAFSIIAKMLNVMAGMTKTGSNNNFVKFNSMYWPINLIVGNGIWDLIWDLVIELGLIPTGLILGPFNVFYSAQRLDLFT